MMVHKKKMATEKLLTEIKLWAVSSKLVKKRPVSVFDMEKS